MEIHHYKVGAGRGANSQPRTEPSLTHFSSLLTAITALRQELRDTIAKKNKSLATKSTRVFILRLLDHVTCVSPRLKTFAPGRPVPLTLELEKFPGIISCSGSSFVLWMTSGGQSVEPPPGFAPSNRSGLLPRCFSSGFPAL
jgi:hypothetical protein